MDLSKNKKAMFASKRGFTFVELIIAIFIFSLMMISVAKIFASSFGGYRSARIIQKDLEDAQFIMNQVAKTLRTSSVISGAADNVVVFDYVQRACFKYAFTGEKIKVGKTNEPAITSPLSSERELFEKDPITWCSGKVPVSSSLTSMAAFTVQGRFFTTSSNKNLGLEKMGKVTMSMSICSNTGCTGDKANIQTTVSLRDYYNAGI